jgi:hypothetical protein
VARGKEVEERQPLFDPAGAVEKQKRRAGAGRE